MYLIERNIPIPEAIRGNGNSNRQYPFLDMEVGDSFYIPQTMGRNGLSAAIWRAKREMAGANFITRNWEDGLRCWRVK
jgi:hypothetical protein